jgi:type II secretory pathway component PulK
VVVIPEGMRLRVEIWDESGRINLNNLKPRDRNAVTAVNREMQSENPRRTQMPLLWTDGLRNLFEARGVNPDVADEILNRWLSMAELAFPAQAAGTPGTQRTPTPTPGAAQPGMEGDDAAASDPAASSLDPWPTLWMHSLEEADRAGLTAADIRRLRSFATAVPLIGQQPQKINVNTASRLVLNAVTNSPEWVDETIARRQTETIVAASLSGLPQNQDNDRGPSNPRALLDVRSSLFLIRASAIVNVNPLTGRGGISRSAEMLVQRALAPARPDRVQRTSAGGTLPTWKLTRLHWEKEGGAVLFRPEVETGTSEQVDSEY